jgi:hypothetical protein
MYLRIDKQSFLPAIISVYVCIQDATSSGYLLALAYGLLLSRSDKPNPF